MAKRYFFSQQHANWPARLTVPEGHEMTINHPSTRSQTAHRHEEGELILPKGSHIIGMRHIETGVELMPAQKHPVGEPLEVPKR
jgi:hypothetical protein